MKFLVISLLIAPLIGQSVKMPSSSEAKIKGRVIASEQPLPFPLHEAEVTGLDQNHILGRAIIDDGGNYEIQNIPPGKYLLRVLLAGFRESKFPIEVLPGKELIIDMPLEVGMNHTAKALLPKVEGFVRNEHSSPRPDATVILFDAHKRKVIAQTKTNAQGYFYFHLKDYRQVVLYALKDDHLLGATASTMQDHVPVTIMASAS